MTAVVANNNKEQHVGLWHFKVSEPYFSACCPIVRVVPFSSHFSKFLGKTNWNCDFLLQEWRQFQTVFCSPLIGSRKSADGLFRSISAFNDINQVFFQKSNFFGSFNFAAYVMQMNVRKPPFVEIITLNFSFY